MKLTMDESLKEEFGYLTGMASLWEECRFPRAEIHLSPSRRKGNILVDWGVGDPYEVRHEELRDVSLPADLKLTDHGYEDYLRKELLREQISPLSIITGSSEVYDRFYMELLTRGVRGSVNFDEEFHYFHGTAIKVSAQDSVKRIVDNYTNELLCYHYYVFDERFGPEDK